MEYRDNGSRFSNYKKWEENSTLLYDYENEGLIKHILSHTIVESTNPILKYVLIYYEKSIVFLLKYVDRLKHFKNYHWKNR